MILVMAYLYYRFRLSALGFPQPMRDAEGRGPRAESREPRANQSSDE
jgi:hypothetical protein